jgi:nickel transport protein
MYETQEKEYIIMKRFKQHAGLTAAIVLGLSLSSFAHYQMILPSDDYLSEGENHTIELQLIFTHPNGAIHSDSTQHETGTSADPTSMDMEAPVEFGVLHKGLKTSLIDTLEAFKFEHGTISVDAYRIEYRARGLGDFVFYLAPGPYYDSIEDAYITQYSKLIVNSGGLPTDWSDPVGLKAEIVPLTPTTPLWVGNMFTGVVLLDGKPVAGAELEVEHLNPVPFKGAFPAVEAVALPDGNYGGQQIMADENGVFSYSFPWSGWWGFVVLLEGEDYDGKGQEIGSCLTFRVYDSDEAP